FRGKVYPVNPKYKKIMGLKAYSSLSELPEPVDLTIIIRPAHEILKILKESPGHFPYYYYVPACYK
ncbi:MAG: CoA-binding protein, partial [Nitrospirota bacterium]